MDKTTLIISGTAAGVALLLFWWPIFRSFRGFLSCLMCCGTPDDVSHLLGKYDEDRWARGKIAIWLLTGVLAFAGTMILLQSRGG